MTPYRWLLLVVAGIALWWMPGVSRAATGCDASLSGVEFQQVDPYGYTDVRATISYRCSSFGFTWAHVAICFSPGNGSFDNSLYDRRMRNQFGDEISFQLYRDASHTAVWGPQEMALELPIISYPVFIFGGVSETVDVYARIPPQPDTAAGDYSSFFSGASMTYRYVERNNAGNLRCDTGAGTPGQGPIPFPVNAVVPPSCKVLTTTALDFTGAAPLTGTRTGNLDATAAINLECRKRTAWKIGLDEGLHHDGSRRMSNGSQYIRYELRQTPSGPIWGDVPDGNVLPGTGTGQSQTRQVHGRVPDQPLTGAGTYSDTVKVTVTY